MKFIITGSGGCVCLPKPLCQCRVCVEARQKGGRYKRYGCSLYLEDISLLVDTPEDIAWALNDADIRNIEHVFYTHRDPDHTMGIRIFEQLRLEWLDYYAGISPKSPVEVCATPEVMETVNGIGIGYGSILDYYEHLGLAKRRLITQPVSIGNIKITAVAVPKNKAVSVFVFEEGARKVIYAPCDCMPFPMDGIMHNADMLIIGNTVIGETLKDGRGLGIDNPLRRELHNMEDVLGIKKELSINEVIVTHIEEAWGKSYDDYLALENTYGVTFAYDGMVVEV